MQPYQKEAITLSEVQIDALNALIFDECGGINSFYQRITDITISYARMTIMLLEKEGDALGDAGDVYILSELMKVFAED